MEEQKDRALETPGEANRDKHVNFLAAGKGDEDIFEKSPDEEETNPDAEEQDNGFFTTEDNDTGNSKPGENNDLFKTPAKENNPGKGLAGTHDLS